MKLTHDSGYSKLKDNQFPSDGLSSEAKGDKDYFLKACRAIVSKYVNNMCALPYRKLEDKDTIRTLREYSEGQQDVNIYKDILVGHKDQHTGKRRKTTINISWRKLNILPKKLRDVQNYLAKIKYIPQATGIDKQAIIAKEHIKSMTKLAIKEPIFKLHEELNGIMGEQVVEQDPELAQQPMDLPFNNDQQVERFAENGGFQLEQEIAIATLNEKTNEVSGFGIIEGMLNKDRTDIGIAGVRIYKDHGSNIIKLRYVDPENAIIPYSIYPDFRDATYFGELRRMSIYQLRTESDLSEIDIIKIAKKYNDAPYNAENRIDTNFFRDIYDARNNGLGLEVLDSIEVEVADCVWLGKKNLRQTRIVREKDGSLALNNVDDNYALKDKDRRKGKEIKEYSSQTVYKASHIIGTDCVFNWGQEKNIAFEKTYSGRRVAVLPYSFMASPSITEQCIGFVDDIHIALYKKRMAIRQMPVGPNIMINPSAFEGVRIGGKDYSPADIMNLYKDEGFLIAGDKNIFNTSSSQPRAIDVIPTDVTRQLIECRNEINENILKLEEVTGINQAFSGANPTSNQGLGTTQIAINATGNAIHHIVEAHKHHLEAIARITTHMWKVSSKYMTDKERERLGVARSLKYIAIGKDIAEFEFDLKMEASITEEELRMLQQEILQLKDFRRQAGTGGLMPSDALLLFDMIRSGNIKQARLALSQIEEFRQMSDEKIAEKRYQENAQLQMQSNEQATENKMNEIQAEGQMDIEKEIVKIRAQMELERIKGEEKRKEIAASNVYGWGAQAYADKAKVGGK